ncbi:MAG: bifunctional nuclease family protein [Muribaculaceae bacterium]|nr:bifunctional nuclease family protein [Muribaculaceae bacterium]
MEKKNIVELEVYGVSRSQIQSVAYALVLKEKNGKRLIPVVVGANEAQSIVAHMQGAILPRPLTHDLMTSVFHAYGIALEEVMIYRYDEGIFYSHLLLRSDTTEVELDARTSDAVAMALRTGARIFTNEEIMNRVSFLKEEVSDTGENSTDESTSLETMTLEGLKSYMERCVEAEDYEQAAEIQKEIRRRTQE